MFILLCLLLSIPTCQNNAQSIENQEGQDKAPPPFPLKGEIVFQSNVDGDNEIFLLDKTGVKKLTDNDWSDEFPSWSPDGKKIAFTANPNGNYDIFIMNPDGSAITPLTTSPTEDTDPTWSADGKSVLYAREVDKFVGREVAVYRVSVQKKSLDRIIPSYKRTHGIPHASPTSPLMVFTAKRTIGWDVAIYDFESKSVKFLEEGGDSCRARFSRDGKKLAYVSGKADGKGDIWLMNPDGTGKMRLTERDETYDYFPSWSPDGKYVVFNSSQQHDHNGDWQLFVIEVDTKKTMLIYDSPGNDVFPDWR